MEEGWLINNHSYIDVVLFCSAVLYKIITHTHTHTHIQTHIHISTNTHTHTNRFQFIFLHNK